MPQPHIVLIAPPWYPVPPRGYGGIELVVGLLARGLRARGWRVSLIAAEGSDGDAILHAPAAWRHDLGGSAERLRELTYAARVSRAVMGLGPVDLIHDHVGFASLLAVSATGCAPVVHTVHGVVGEVEATFLAELDDSVDLIAISADQRRLFPTLPWIATVYNAVDVDQLIDVGRETKEPYLLCLARICPDKGQHLAIEAAQRVGMRLVLAGKVDRGAASHRYFEERVRPLIDGDRVQHVANVRGRHKALLLSRAQALLAPIQWEEPFGLSMVEAMASGTPVISFARGAAPEVIDIGLTGFLVEDVDGMVDALGKLKEIDPERCATTARARFGPDAMADGYVQAYEQRRDRVLVGSAGMRAASAAEAPEMDLDREAVS